MSSVEKEIRELQGQIYKLLLQVKKMKEFQHSGWPSEREAEETWVCLADYFGDDLLEGLKGKFNWRQACVTPLKIWLWVAHLIRKKYCLTYLPSLYIER